MTSNTTTSDTHDQTTKKSSLSKKASKQSIITAIALIVAVGLIAGAYLYPKLKPAETDVSNTQDPLGFAGNENIELTDIKDPLPVSEGFDGNNFNFDREKYTQEYFDQAQSENRMLNDEENLALFLLNLKENTIADAYVKEKEVSCTIADLPIGADGETVTYKFSFKQNKIRVDGYKNDEEASFMHLLADDTRLWSWDTDDNNPNGYASMPLRSHKLGFLESGLGQDIHSQEIYASSCTEGPVDDSIFIPPTDVEFVDFDAQQDIPAEVETAPQE